MIGCDPIVAANKATLAVMREGRTYVALNTHGTPTAAFVDNPDWQFPGGNCEAAIARRGRRGAASARFDAEQVAMQLLGDSIYTNPLMLGYAWQKGRVPLSARGADARDRAERRAGRQQQGAPSNGAGAARTTWPRCRRCSRPAQVIQFVKKPSLDEMVAKRVEFLTGYQNAAYAAAVQGLRRQGARRRGAAGRARSSAEAVARYLFKLMAYKDEYEVARLHTDPAFVEQDRRACSKATTSWCTTWRRR